MDKHGVDRMKEAAAGWERYSANHHIPSLFQALLVGLVHERPEDAHQYLMNCMEYVTEHEVDSSTICWDTFLNSQPSRTSETSSPFPAKLPPIRSSGTPIGDRVPSAKPSSGLSTRAGQHNDDGSPTPKRASPDQCTEAGKMPDLLQDHDGLAYDPFASADGEAQMEDLAKVAAQLQMLGKDAIRCLQGDWSRLPSLPSNIVRIFLSSTFSDFKVERNILPRRSYPELQAYCQERGLDFQVVDMRWGVTDEVMHEHQVSMLCLNEIKRCQELSCGPNFVAFLGNRYGFQPFQAQIEQSQFEAFVAIAEELNLDNRHLLEEWFLLDTNAIPAKYILQPILQKLPDYNNHDNERATERTRDRQIWAETQCHLQAILRKCVLVARERHLVSDDIVEQHFMSVTEEEISFGLLKQTESSKRQVLGFVRELSGLSEQVGVQPGIHRYIDLTQDGSLDQDTQARLQLLVQNKLPSSLTDANICRYTVPWLGEALETSNKEEYLSYLTRFADDFTRQVKRLIDINQKESARMDENEQIFRVFEEALHHARYASHKVEAFYGMEEEVEKIKQYLECDKSDRQPLVIAGASGYGKTTFVAHVALNTTSWLGNDAVLVTRFLGKSPASTTLQGALKSVIIQICILFKLPIPTENWLQGVQNIREIFWMLLQRVGELGQRKLVIIFDSVNMLHATFGAHTLIWLPRTLPKNIYIIVSLPSDRHICYAHVKQRIPDPGQYIHLKPLSSDRALQILNKFLGVHKRQVTQIQQDYILEACKTCKQPLYLRLMMEEAKTWNSYTPVSDLVPPKSVHDAIVTMFRDLEGRFGEVFVQHALGYLTCSKGGISSVEMEDVLSCDDDVLNHVYEYHDPPVDGMIRIPSLMWSRLQDALKQHLVERHAYGKTVYSWYNRHFLHAAQDLYVSTTEERIFLHSNHADVFIQENGIKRTITLYKRKGKILQNADRGVTYQPLNPKNDRKLESMVYHLVKSNRIMELKQICLMNYKWLLTKLMASGAHALLHMFEEICESDETCNSDKEVNIMLDLVRLSVSALWHDPALLAHQIVDRLDEIHKKYNLLSMLYNEAKHWINAARIPLLIPTHPIGFQKPGTPLCLTSLAGSSGLLNSDQTLILCNHVQPFSPCGVFNVFDLKRKEILVSVPNSNASHYCLMARDSQFIYADKDHLTIRDLNSGDAVKSVRYENQDFQKITIRCLAVNDTGSFATLGARLGKPLSRQKITGNAGGKLYLVNLETSQTIDRLEFPGRRCIDFVEFIDNDTKVLATCRTEMCILDATTFSILIVEKLDEQKLFNFTIGIASMSGMIFGASGSYTKMRALTYAHSEGKLDYSSALNLENEAYTRPFGLSLIRDGEQVVIGAYSKEEIPRSNIGIWDRVDDSHRYIPLQARGPAKPSAMVLDSSCQYICVGWANADIEIIHLDKEQQLCTFKVNAQGIDSIKFLDTNDMLLIFSVDNSINMWDFQEIIQESNNPIQSKGEMTLNEPSSGHMLVGASDSLATAGETTTFAMGADFALSAPAKANQCPGVWDLTRGRLHHDMIEVIKTQYPDLFHEHFPNYDYGTLGGSKFMVIGTNHVVYQRHGGLQAAACVFKFDKTMSIHAYRTFTGVYAPRMLINKYPTSASEQPRMEMKYYIVKDTAVDILTLPDMKEEKSISINPISAEIRNPFSNNGRRKLKAMKVALTQDNRYLIIFNGAVTVNNGTQKPLDLIDLQKGIFLRRYLLPKHVSGRVMVNSITYLVLKDEECYLFTPSDIEKQAGDISSCYCCPLETGRLVSEDASLGIELNNKTRTAYLWRLKPLKKLHALTGHTSDLTFADISADNKYVATASSDKTVRVWSTQHGQQLCCFHLDYGIDSVKFNAGPNANYIGVLCFSKQQHKRLVLLNFRDSSSHRPSLIGRETTSTDIGL